MADITFNLDVKCQIKSAASATQWRLRWQPTKTGKAVLAADLGQIFGVRSVTAFHNIMASPEAARTEEHIQ